MAGFGRECHCQRLELKFCSTESIGLLPTSRRDRVTGAETKQARASCQAWLENERVA